MKIKLLLGLLLMGSQMACSSTTNHKMIPYEIELSQRTLTFALPDVVAKRISPLQISPAFDQSNKGFAEKGYLYLGSDLFDFGASLGNSAASCSLKFDIVVQRKNNSYARKLDSADALVSYWEHEFLRRNEHDWKFGTQSIGSQVWALRELNTIDTQTTSGRPRHRQIYSIPLAADLILDFSFEIIIWREDEKSLSEAMKFRELIKGSISVK